MNKQTASRIYNRFKEWCCTPGNISLPYPIAIINEAEQIMINDEIHKIILRSKNDR